MTNDELRRLAEAAKAQPRNSKVTREYRLAASPDAVLKLLDENDRLRGLLKRCEWSVHDDDYRNYCPICMEYQDDGHAPDCELAQALRGEG